MWQGSGATWIALRKLRSIQATLATLADHQLCKPDSIMTPSQVFEKLPEGPILRIPSGKPLVAEFGICWSPLRFQVKSLT